MNKYIQHLYTIGIHKWYVFKVCKDLNILWRGITHDMSKFSYQEFIPSARYFHKGVSPLKVMKIKDGYCLAWNHHKGVNRHHWEWWLDCTEGNLYSICPEWKDILEMFADWVGAGIAYNSGKFYQEEPLNYLLLRKDLNFMHPLLLNCSLAFLSAMADRGYNFAISTISQVKEIYTNGDKSPYWIKIQKDS